MPLFARPSCLQIERKWVLTGLLVPIVKGAGLLIDHKVYLVSDDLSPLFHEKQIRVSSEEKLRDVKNGLAKGSMASPC